MRWQICHLISEAPETAHEGGVPLEIRRRLGLREGDRLEFVAQGELTLIRPARDARNPFAAYAGALGTFPDGVAEINAWVDDVRRPGKPRLRTTPM